MVTSLYDTRTSSASVLCTSVFFWRKILLRLQPLITAAILLGLHAVYGSYAWADSTPKQTPEKAIQPISEAVARARMQRSASGIYDVLVAYLNLQRGNTKDAYTHLLAAAKNHPESSLFQMAIDSALRQKSPRLANKALQQWLTAIPNDARAHLNTLRLLLIKGDILETREPLKLAQQQIAPEQLQQFIYDLPAVYALGKKPKLTQQVLQPELEAALENKNTRYAAAISLARIYLGTKQYKQALHVLTHTKQAALPKEKLGSVANVELPALVAVTVIRAIPPTEKNKLLNQEAQRIVQDTLRTQTASKQIYLTYIKALLEHKQVDQALLQLQKFRKQYPKSLTGHMLTGAISMERAQWKTAKRALLEYVKLRKRGITMETPSQKSAFVSNLLSTKHTARTDIRVYAMLARATEMIHIKQRNAPSVQIWLNRAAETAEEKEVWLQHIDWLTRKKHYTRAIQRIRQLAQKNQTITKPLQALMVSHVYERQKQYTQAIQVLNTEIQAAPNNTDLLYARGLAYDSSGKHTQAERDYRRVLAIDPQSSAALNALGYGLADRNERLDEAHTLIMQAIKIDPTNAAIQDSVGWVKYRMGKLDEALVWLKKAFITAPQADVAAHLGEVLWKTGDTALARALWKKALQKSPDNDVLLETVRRLAPSIEKTKNVPKTK